MARGPDFNSDINSSSSSHDQVFNPISLMGWLFKGSIINFPALSLLRSEVDYVIAGEINSGIEC